MKLYKAEAVVLKAWNCGNGDKLLILYSREFGKIKVMAHGAARPSSRKRGAVQPFNRTSFLIRRGKELDSISQCEVLDMFSFLRDDLRKIVYASYLTELVELLTPEGEPNEGLYRLLLLTMRLMEEGDLELLARAFELKATGLIGYRPVFENCANCQGTCGQKTYFSSLLGGTVCETCLPSAPDAVSCSRGGQETMKLLLQWDMQKLNRLKVDRVTRNEIRGHLYKYIKHHLERDLRTVKFLEDSLVLPVSEDHV